MEKNNHSGNHQGVEGAISVLTSFPTLVTTNEMMEAVRNVDQLKESEECVCPHWPCQWHPTDCSAGGRGGRYQVNVGDGSVRAAELY